MKIQPSYQCQTKPRTITHTNKTNTQLDKHALTLSHVHTHAHTMGKVGGWVGCHSRTEQLGQPNPIRVNTLRPDLPLQPTPPLSSHLLHPSPPICSTHLPSSAPPISPTLLSRSFPNVWWLNQHPCSATSAGVAMPPPPPPKRERVKNAHCHTRTHQHHGECRDTDVRVRLLIIKLVFLLKDFISSLLKKSREYNSLQEGKEGEKERAELGRRTEERTDNVRGRKKG